MDDLLSRSAHAPPGIRANIRASIQDQVRLAVEAEILSGVRPPGSAIDDRDLSRRFEVSRTPVREALLRLAAEGLVDIAPRAGIYVHRASAGELIALLEALCETEATLARLAARRAGAEQVAAMTEALEAGRISAAKGDRADYVAQNARFHEAIYAAGGNVVLVGHVRSIRKRLASYRRRAFDMPGRLVRSALEHGVVAAGVAAGDEAAAEAAMRAHIGAGGEAMAVLILAAERDEARRLD